MTRDGGCIIPGCTVPAGWTEIHHVRPDAEGGPTHTDNGVCLCWWHHHMLEMSGWQIRMHHGRPQVRAPGWLDPYGTWRDASKAATTRKDQLLKRLN
jgi:5-methylcytosine-specific restriction protein A